MTSKISKIEALLFALARPVKTSELARSLNMNEEEVRADIEELRARYNDRGIVLVSDHDKHQLVTDPKYTEVVAEFLQQETREKLTEAAIETLAIILYKQPITRAELESIRGVNSQYILRQLLIRGLIEKTASPQDARRAVYKTTLDFMNSLGIKDLKDLPDFEELTKHITVPEEMQFEHELLTKQPESSDGSGGDNGKDENDEKTNNNCNENTARHV